MKEHRLYIYLFVILFGGGISCSGSQYKYIVYKYEYVLEEFDSNCDSLLVFYAFDKKQRVVYRYSLMKEPVVNSRSKKLLSKSAFSLKEFTNSIQKKVVYGGMLYKKELKFHDSVEFLYNIILDTIKTTDKSVLLNGASRVILDLKAGQQYNNVKLISSETNNKYTFVYNNPLVSGDKVKYEYTRHIGFTAYWTRGASCNGQYKLSTINGKPFIENQSSDIFSYWP